MPFMFFLNFWTNDWLCYVLLSKHTFSSFVNIYIAHVLSNRIFSTENSCSKIFTFNPLFKINNWRPFIGIHFDVIDCHCSFGIQIYQLKYNFFLSLSVYFESKKQVIFNFRFKALSLIIWQDCWNNYFWKILLQSIHFNPNTHLIIIVKMTFD